MEEMKSRISIHDFMIALSYGHGVECGHLTDDEVVGLRRLAQMVVSGVTWFEACDFGKPLGWNDERSTAVIENLWKKHPERHVTCYGGIESHLGYCNAANIGTVEHITTEEGVRHKIYNFMIDGVASHLEQSMRLAGQNDVDAGYWEE